MERMVLNLDEQIEAVRAVLEAKNAARENAIEKSRKLVQFCGSAIRAMHRQDWNGAQNLLTTARDALIAMREGVTKYPDLYYAGYFQDAAKEFVEASLTFAMLRDVTLPTPAELQVEEATYLNGLCEAASELRRYVLDILRHDHDLSASEQAEQLLAKMDTVYSVVVTVDFPDVISGGLRHRTDQLRGVLERTRGDVTTSIRQQRLQAALEKVDRS